MQQVGALTSFFRNKAVDMDTKRQIFLAIPANTALYGCESWALKAHHRRKLTSFYHKSIRRILGISMHRVEKDHIKNEHIRNLFGVADIHDELQLRPFRWLGQLARQPDVTATKRLLSAWIATPRRCGAPHATARSTYAERLRTILGPDIMTDDLGRLRDWLSLAQSRAQFSKKINKESEKKRDLAR
jgi:hypothetical protein